MSVKERSSRKEKRKNSIPDYHPSYHEHTNSYNENSESERSLNRDDDDVDSRHLEENIDDREKEEEEDSSSDYVISSDSDMDACPLFTAKKTNVLGLKRRRIKKGPILPQDDEGIVKIFCNCCGIFLHSCCWTILAVIICLVVLGFSYYFEFKWWHSYTIKELGKGMYYLNDSKVHPYKVEIPNDRVYMWYDQRVKRYGSRLSLFSKPMVRRAGKARVQEKRSECHLYNLIVYKDKYHRPNDPPPKNATEAQIKNYLGACILLGNMTEQSWDLEVRFQKHIQNIFGVAF